MTIAESYACLARMLEYPRDREMLQEDSNDVSAFLKKRRLACPLAPFIGFVAAANLTALQEDYVATFDFNPAVAPYLGHHLHGDNQKKGAYMIRVKQEFDRHGFSAPGNELPDHLPLLLAFLAHLAQNKNERARQAFIAGDVLPGMERLLAAFADRHNSPWESAVKAARLLCVADTQACKEEKSC